MGCTLLNTPEDNRQSRESRSPTPLEKLPKERREKIREALERTPREVMVKILSDPQHPGYLSVQQLLARAMDPQHTMTQEEFARLPEATAKILRDHPKALGLFQKAGAHYGPGATPVQHHYEVFAAAALKSQDFSTRSQKHFSIHATDRLDFGIKFAAGYAQPKHFGTVEADLLISRGSMNVRTLAVDAKFSQSGVYNATGDLGRQLAGIRYGLLDGKIDEFYFVTNGRFGGTFTDRVAKENLKIAEAYAKSNASLYRDVPQKCLTRQELESQPLDRVPEAFFRPTDVASMVQVQQFIDKHHIPQIEICENVRYPGT